MLPVEILPVQETIVLRARGSELLILPHHVKKLKDLTKPRDFSQYFRAEALVNRPARKLFEAWLRKDHTLWPRLYQTVHKEMTVSGEGEAAAADPAASAKAEAPAEKTEKKAKKKDDEPKAEKPKAEKKEKAEAKAEKPKAEKKEKAEKPKAEKKEKAEKPKAEKKEKAEPKAEKPKAKTAAKKKG